MKNMSRHINTIALTTLFLCLGLSTQAQDIKTNLFKQADEVLTAAKIARANILAPENFEKASKYYQSAEEKLTAKKSIESINIDLSKAVSHLEKAVEATRIAEVTFASTIAARNDSVSAESETFAAAEWIAAESAFKQAAIKLEDGSVKAAQKKAAEAESMYRIAELAAIKNNYLAEAIRLISIAEKDKVKKLAPITLENATTLLAQADKELNENRYDTDEARNLARRAKQEAQHALNIATTLKKIKRGKISTEQLTLQYQSELQKIASSLDLFLATDETDESITETITQKIALLTEDSVELSDRREQIIALENEIRALQQQMGTQSVTINQQNAIRQTFNKVESIFLPSEALVYRQGNNVLIRMIGLNFDTGKSVIESEYFTTLRKIISVITLFPNSSVNIEGHTDSFGSDTTNLTLSQARADAVKSYLNANMQAIDADKITAAGYGESRPVANNELDEGRRKNRRIDIVIRPSP